MQTPARLRPLLEQYDFALEWLINRLEGMTDEEYLWEPVDGCWSIRPREQTETKLAYGAGDWVLEYDAPDPEPPLFTTLAWRLNHLASGMLTRADYTIGSKAMVDDDYNVPVTAADAVETLQSAGASWREALTTADDAALDQVGRCSFPYGRDPDLPFLDVCWWVNQELLHHGAEMALLRDLYRTQSREVAVSEW